MRGLELDFGTGSIVESEIGDIDIITTQEYDRDPHFKWDFGRVGAGVQGENIQLGAF